MRVPLLLSSLLLFSAVQAQTLVPFSDPTLPFKVNLPQGWLGAQFDDGTNGVSLVSAKQPPATLIRLLFLPKQGVNVDLSQEFKRFEAGVQAAGAQVKVISSRNESVGGVPGVMREYQVTHPKGQLLMRVWYGNGAKTVYSFQVSDSPARFTLARATFEKVLASVSFGR